MDVLEFQSIINLFMADIYDYVVFNPMGLHWFMLQDSQSPIPRKSGAP